MPVIDLNPIENLWDIMYRYIHCRQVAPQTVQELTDALIQVWKEIPTWIELTHINWPSCVCYSHIWEHDFKLSKVSKELSKKDYTT